MAWRRLIPIGFILGAIGVCLWVPIGWVEQTPLCLFRLLTGFDCPGCGLTRAFFALLKGDLYSVYRLNALAPVIFLFLIIYLADHLHAWRRGRRPSWFTVQGNRWITASFAVLFFGQWIYKTGVHLTALFD